MVTGPRRWQPVLICMVTFARTLTGHCGPQQSGHALCRLADIVRVAGTLLLSSAIYLHTVPCCLLMRPLQPQPEQHRPVAGAAEDFDQREPPEAADAAVTAAARAAPIQAAPHPAGWLARLAARPLALPARAALHHLPAAQRRAQRRSAAAARYHRLSATFADAEPRLAGLHASRFLLASAAPAFFAYTADRCLHLGFGQGRAALLAVLSPASMAGTARLRLPRDRGLASPLAIYGLALLAGGLPGRCQPGSEGLRSSGSLLFGRRLVLWFGVLLASTFGRRVCSTRQAAYNATFMLIGASLATSGLLVLEDLPAAASTDSC
uniref:EamA domain-containing protein n=1 Tax=Macrostomum lignano TaxID=282301 RepID=A0A1I8FQ30_9PLAT